MPKKSQSIESNDPDPEQEAIEALYAAAEEAQELVEAAESEAEGEGGANPDAEPSDAEAESSGASDQEDKDEEETGETASTFPHPIFPRWENASNEALRREINGWSNIKKLPEDLDFDTDFLRRYIAYLNHCGAMGVNPERWLSYDEVDF